MNNKDWENFWYAFDTQADKIDAKFQREMAKKHGGGHYYIEPDDHWARQQKIIRKLVEAKLKEKHDMALPPIPKPQGQGQPSP